MMKLYHLWKCPYSMRARLVLAEKGLEYDSCVADPDDKPASQLAINPDGTFPTLADDGVGVWESQVVCEYLDEAYPDPHLMPTEPTGRADVRLLFALCSKGIEGPVHRLGRPDALDADEAAELEQTLHETLQRVDRRFGDEPYFTGKAFGMGDVALASFVLQVPRLDAYTGGIPGRLTDWMERIAERDSVRNQVLEHI